MLELKLKRITGNLPTSEYELFDGGALVGIIQIRQRVSRGIGMPEDMASHIYYEIFPVHRQKGYGKKILALGKEEARKIGLEEIILVCHAENIGSKKIIEANGGVFMRDALISGTGKKMLKYRIALI